MNILKSDGDFTVVRIVEYYLLYFFINKVILEGDVTLHATSSLIVDTKMESQIALKIPIVELYPSINPKRMELLEIGDEENIKRSFPDRKFCLTTWI